jgi:8-oxo-dGTP pyrophosphatase MutT (NUDIX family)
MNLQPWKVISSKTFYQSPWIEVIEDECEINDKKVTYTRVKRLDEGSMIIPEDDDGRLWLVQQYRHPIHKIVWQFPAGGQNEGESWQESAERELAEEMKKKAGSMTDLGIFYPDPGLLDQTSHVFLAQNLIDLSANEQNQHQQDEVEDLRIQAFTLTEIDQLIDAGEICDGWILGGLYLYKKYKKSKSV